MVTVKVKPWISFQNFGLALCHSLAVAKQQVLLDRNMYECKDV